MLKGLNKVNDEETKIFIHSLTYQYLCINKIKIKTLSHVD